LLGLHKEIRAHSDLRVKIQVGIDRLRLDGLDARDAWRKQVQDENETLKNVLMPCYREMVKTFREKLWLAGKPATGA
jgi:adenylate cyclase